MTEDRIYREVWNEAISAVVRLLHDSPMLAENEKRALIQLVVNIRR